MADALLTRNVIIAYRYCPKLRVLFCYRWNADAARNLQAHRIDPWAVADPVARIDKGYIGPKTPLGIA